MFVYLLLYLQLGELRIDYFDGAIFTSSVVGRYAFGIQFEGSEESFGLVPSSQILKKSLSLIFFVHKIIYSCSPFNNDPVNSWLELIADKKN